LNTDFAAGFTADFTAGNSDLNRNLPPSAITFLKEHGGTPSLLALLVQKYKY
jgi:hypothetical protein